MDTESPLAPHAVLINGTVGVGKTSVAEGTGDLLTAAGVPHAVIDLDWLSQAWPAPAGDPFHTAMMLRNLRAVAGNYLAAGAVRLVLAGVIEGAEDREAIADALGTRLSVCRLRADLPVIHQRLTHRHAHEPEALRWHLARSGELAAILERAAADDFTLDVTTSPIPETAADVLAKLGWS
ncbi:hypothetical protein ABZ766_23805 [Streptomyces sp. NPDC006670]|uniref:hypothetical protein n=1 Tax=Streptomyces sp. NPDC006670 TaxID=3154476 RepID=UPI0033FE4C6C